MNIYGNQNIISPKLPKSFMNPTYNIHASFMLLLWNSSLEREREREREVVSQMTLHDFIITL
jgi:hypothetical protein